MYIREDLERALAGQEVGDLIELTVSDMKVEQIADSFSVPPDHVLLYSEALIDLQTDETYTGHLSSVDALVVAARQRVDRWCRTGNFPNTAPDYDLEAYEEGTYDY